MNRAAAFGRWAHASGLSAFAVWLCLPMIRCRGLWPQPMPALFSLRSVQLSAVASAAGAGRDVHQSIRQHQCRLRTYFRYGPAQTPADWNAYGGNKAGTRYAPFEAINADNVNQLQRAWEVRTGVPGRFSGTPLQISDGIYLCTAKRHDFLDLTAVRNAGDLIQKTKHRRIACLVTVAALPITNLKMSPTALNARNAFSPPPPTHA